MIPHIQMQTGTYLILGSKLQRGNTKKWFMMKKINLFLCIQKHLPEGHKNLGGIQTEWQYSGAAITDNLV